MLLSEYIKKVLGAMEKGVEETEFEICLITHPEDVGNIYVSKHETPNKIKFKVKKKK